MKKMKKKERKILLEIIATTVAKCDGLKTRGRTFADSPVYGPMAKAVLAALDANGFISSFPDPEDVARVIWETSRRDEGTISATGADIVARAVMPLFTVISDVKVKLDEDTLFKVKRALWRSGLSEGKAIDAISQLQNEGILFREREQTS